MRDNIFGEESNTFTNSLGECITVQIQASDQETAQLLGKVMGDGQHGAKTLAEEIHKDIDSDLMWDTGADIPEGAVITNYAEVGVWIDPIGG